MFNHFKKTLWNVKKKPYQVVTVKKMLRGFELCPCCFKGHSSAQDREFKITFQTFKAFSLEFLYTVTGNWCFEGVTEHASFNKTGQIKLFLYTPYSSCNIPIYWLQRWSKTF